MVEEMETQGAEDPFEGCAGFEEAEETQGTAPGAKFSEVGESAQVGQSPRS